MGDMRKYPTHEERCARFGAKSDRQNTRWTEIVQNCEHDWKPTSMVFETQLLDDQGRVIIRQPDAVNGRENAAWLWPRIKATLENL